MNKKFLNHKLIKNNFYSTYYFLKTKEVIDNDKNYHISTLQWKTNNDIEYMVAGIKEILSILRISLPKKTLRQLIIKYPKEGTIIKKGQCAFSITGQYSKFCHLENIIDGILARRSSVATNCWKILSLVKPEKIVFMSDRSDDYRMHPYDGYSAYIAGIRQFSNHSHIALIKDKNLQVFGSMPHALIHQYNGDIVKTFLAYKKIKEYDGVILIDFNNDVINELKKLTPYFDQIKGVRLDTSINMIDKSLQNRTTKLYGVNDKLVRLVRNYLDKNNGKHIKIVVSSNNNYDTISNFSKLKTPIDFYGIGTYLTSLSLHFTADLVDIDNKNFAKVGRKKLDDKHLITWDYKSII